MKIKILLFALCILHQTYTAQPPSLQEAKEQLASMCRFTRGVDYVANPHQRDEKLTRHVATQALAFLYNNKRKPQSPASVVQENLRICAFTSPDGQVFETVWQAAQSLEKVTSGLDYLPDLYTITNQ